ncbi:hypothetical protein [Halorubrum saccharovorum]|uniref:hypothetical protein n=1 Tax=Halorubrum saccharovorum TaxID=2248 RepID=UPI00128D053F|nr:hypothetical protein [Halorubrum saccharovorum]
MPLQKFQIYDVIVDIIPGIVFSALLIPLIIPSSRETNIPAVGGGVAIAIVLLAVGYVLGRVVHSFSSLFDSIVRATIRFLEARLMRGRLAGPISQARNKLIPIFGYHYTVEDHIQEAMSPITPFTLKTGSSYRLIEKINKKYEIDVDSLDHGEYLEEYEHFSHSLLYNKQVLYRRYEILATFFRSMYVLCFIFAIAYTISAYQVVGLFERPLLWNHVVKDYGTQAGILVGSLLLLSFIFAHQKRKFSNRRGRALIYDSLIELEKSDEQ